MKKRTSSPTENHIIAAKEKQMVEYPIIEEKILTGEPTECPEYKVSHKRSSVKKKPGQSKTRQEKSTPPTTPKKLTPKEK